MSINDWPEDERPRERLLQRGAAALSDAELLAIFLRTGVAGRSAVDLARDLLGRFGGLRALLKASQHEFCAAHGLGSAKYAQLQAVRNHAFTGVLDAPGEAKQDLWILQQLAQRALAADSAAEVRAL